MSFEEPNHRVSVKANLVGMALPAPSPTFAPVATEEATPTIEPTITHDASVPPLWPPQRLH